MASDKPESSVLSQREARGPWDQEKGVQLREGFLEGLMPEPSAEGQVGLSQSEEHGEGRFGQKEQQVQGHSRAGKGSTFRERKALPCARDGSSEKQGERGRWGLPLAGTKGTRQKAWLLPLRLDHGSKSLSHKTPEGKGL